MKIICILLIQFMVVCSCATNAHCLATESHLKEFNDVLKDDDAVEVARDSSVEKKKTGKAKTKLEKKLEKQLASPSLLIRVLLECAGIVLFITGYLFAPVLLVVGWFLDYKKSKIKIDSVPFYRVDGPGGHVYILGTQHTAVPLKAMPSFVRDTLESSSNTAFEIVKEGEYKQKHEDKMQEIREELVKEQGLEEYSLKKQMKLTDWEYKQLVRIAKWKGIKEGKVKKTLPVYAFLDLMYDFMHDSKGGALDKEISKYAKDKGMGRMALENDARGGKKILVDVFMEHKGLVTTLIYFLLLVRGGIGKWILRKIFSFLLFKIYKKKYKYKNHNEDISSSGDDYYMLYKRNKTWIPKLEDIMRKGGYFVAVGAAHVVDPANILMLLKQKGYIVTSVRNKEEFEDAKKLDKMSFAQIKTQAKEKERFDIEHSKENIWAGIESSFGISEHNEYKFANKKIKLKGIEEQGAKDEVLNNLEKTVLKRIQELKEKKEIPVGNVDLSIWDAGLGEILQIRELMLIVQALLEDGYIEKKDRKKWLKLLGDFKLEINKKLDKKYQNDEFFYDEFGKRFLITNFNKKIRHILSNNCIESEKEVKQVFRDAVAKYKPTTAKIKSILKKVEIRKKELEQEKRREEKYWAKDKDDYRKKNIDKLSDMLARYGYVIKLLEANKDKIIIDKGDGYNVAVLTEGDPNAKGGKYFGKIIFDDERKKGLKFEKDENFVLDSEGYTQIKERVQNLNSFVHKNEKILKNIFNTDDILSLFSGCRLNFRNNMKNLSKYENGEIYFNKKAIDAFFIELTGELLFKAYYAKIAKQKLFKKEQIDLEKNILILRTFLLIEFLEEDYDVDMIYANLDGFESAKFEIHGVPVSLNYIELLKMLRDIVNKNRDSLRQNLTSKGAFALKNITSYLKDSVVVVKNRKMSIDDVLSEYVDNFAWTA